MKHVTIIFGGKARVGFNEIIMEIVQYIVVHAWYMQILECLLTLILESHL
jgi:hypothetical protein